VTAIHAELVATSNADDLALRSLADVVKLTADVEARVVGGHMASIWLAALPVAGVFNRRTTDADSAITTQLASTGDLHDRFLRMGYTDASGNNYVRTIPGIGELSVDILVPSPDGKFRSEQLGDRAFDAAPGLGTVLSAPAVDASIGATLLDGSVLEFSARVPSLEFAVVLKAYAWSLRHANKDVRDIYTLLEIAAGYPAAAIGGWKLNAPNITGSRADAVTILARLAKDARRQTWTDVPSGRLAALIAALTTN
jgi:hypothetical protein